jgi:hypothetical protein
MPPLPVRTVPTNNYAGFVTLVKDLKWAGASLEASIGASNQLNVICEPTNVIQGFTRVLAPSYSFIK